MRFTLLLLLSTNFILVVLLEDFNLHHAHDHWRLHNSRALLS